MANQFIPSGRTSVVKKGSVEYQLQTEFASHPHGRVTTTISAQGEVLHKIEKRIEGDIKSLEEMHEIEEIIKAQHLEISKIIRERGAPTVPTEAPRRVDGQLRSEQIRRLEAVDKVYIITSEGKITGDKETTQQFKKMFKHILKELPEMLGIFSRLPGPEGGYEHGIYEVEPGRIILVSSGAEYYLILLKPKINYSEFQEKLQHILSKQ